MTFRKTALLLMVLNLALERVSLCCITIDVLDSSIGLLPSGTILDALYQSFTWPRAWKDDWSSRPTILGTNESLKMVIALTHDWGCEELSVSAFELCKDDALGMTTVIVLTIQNAGLQTPTED